MLNAWKGNRTVTENGMVTNISSTSALVDLFFTMGAGRKLEEVTLVNLFSKSWEEDPEMTLRAMFYNRDVRGGQGERRSFRIFFSWLCKNHPMIASKFAFLVPTYGRWDDTFVAFGTEVEKEVVTLIYRALKGGDKLCAKWMPRENKKNHAIALKLMEYFDLTPRQYRKLLAGNTQVVESLMCKKMWGEINYSHVPSVASNKYRKAFYRNDAERYAQYVEDVKSGKAKINASAIFPHDIVNKVLYTNISKVEQDSIDAQWKALPNFVPEGKSFIPVCDVSGSMMGEPLLVCISLGIYLAERNISVFKDMFFTFSQSPSLVELKGKSLSEKVRNLNGSDWGYNTNLELLFSTLLYRAVGAGLKQSDMPQYLLIMSDMQFDQAVKSDQRAIDMIRAEYKRNGYEVPGVVFWNLRASSGVPVTVNDSGVALVSGFSPSIMKTVLSGELSPLAVVYRTLNQERYCNIKL